MKLSFDGSLAIMTDFDSFDIGEILICGQCFRFTQTGERSYRIVAAGRVLDIEQEEDRVVFSGTDERDFLGVWFDYFDLGRDYRYIKETLAANDFVMRDAVEFAPGIRILRQDPWETIISFIASQNKQIPQIKQIVRNLAEKYGRPIGDSGEHAFPTLAELQKADIDGLLECKAGFRAKYIMDAVSQAAMGNLPLTRDCGLSVAEIKERLTAVRGIGDKVSDCALLFGFSRCEYFPVDVWVRRIMSRFYFGGADASPNEIHALAARNFGEYAGFAQQYLFHYARMRKF